jgi:hypothetical protein
MTVPLQSPLLAPILPGLIKELCKGIFTYDSTIFIFHLYDSPNLPYYHPSCRAQLSHMHQQPTAYTSTSTTTDAPLQLLWCSAGISTRNFSNYRSLPCKYATVRRRHDRSLSAGSDSGADSGADKGDACYVL